ncbi:DUF389 domain-containing protein [Haloarcula salina]|uniref:DUF389 domain-containing protein n=1 Tax=Haloarcula salina TaxID=1429914 RepID=A0AA41G0S2_9EURY|nr:DUF389 domain-containing protein [Haloarcula salina]MBV0901424.1 DUF389 domain-containing protein [Haloarcula salina]
MRLLQVFVPNEDRAAVRQTLLEMEVEYLFTDEDSDRDGAVAYVPVPSGAVDAVLDELYDAGLDEDTYTVVTDVHRATVPNVDEVTDRYVDGPKGDRGASHPEIRERAADLKPDTATYLAFAALSAIVAVGGLLLDSAIVIVGAMVIAPFAGSTLSASVGAVISDREMVVDSATSQATGLVLAFAGSVAMSAFLQRTGFVPASLVISRVDQVSAFATPNLLTLAIAIAAGIAGALALATDLPVSIAGVAVAAAIVPAAATAGIGVVWGELLLVLGALVLLLMNIVFINLAAYLALVSLGYRSSVIRSLREDVHLSLRSGAYAAVVVVFVCMVALTSAGTYQHLVFEQRVNQEVETVLDDDAYSDLELATVKSGYNDMNLLGRAETVTVTVSRTSETDYGGLDEDLQANVSAATDRPVTVQVRFVDYETAEAAEQSPRLDDLFARYADRLSAFGSRLTRAVGVTAGSPCGAPC